MGKRLIVKILYNVFIFCIIAVLASDPSYGLSVINVDLTSVKQEIEGFGGNGAFYEGKLSNHPKKQEIYNIIFGDLGTSIYRIRNSYETGYSTDMEDQAEAIQAAAESLGHPVKIMISSWTPPNYLKNPATPNGGTLARQYYPDGPYKYGEFAQWWADSLTAYKQLGITATYISIQNEPSVNKLNYPTCAFSETETVDLAGHNKAVNDVYQQLSTMEEPPKILGPDTINTYKAGVYIDVISNLTQIYGYAHHLYGNMGVGFTPAERFDNPDSFIYDMRSFRNNYGYKPIFQTEYARGPDSDGFSEAINTAKHIHNSLVEENVASYMVWGLFWLKDTGQDGYGLVLIDDPYTTVEPGYTIKDTYYAFMHYSKYIQPGYRRIHISNPTVSGLRASAFKSPDEDTIVLVIINPEEENKTFSVTGLNAYILYQIFRTDSSIDNNFKNITNSWDGNLPGKSITTIIYKSAGDYSHDLSYTPIEPCRVADTRISEGGAGPIPGGTQRNFYIAGLCGVPSGPAKAVMVNIAAVNTTGMGNLRAFAYPQTVPFASVLNFGIVAGLNAISNAAIIPICNNDIHSCSFDLSIYVSKTTNVVVDVIGYFAP